MGDKVIKVLSEDCTPGSPHGAQKPFPENEAGSSCQSTAEDELRYRLRGSPASEETSEASSATRNPGRRSPEPARDKCRRGGVTTVSGADPILYGRYVIVQPTSPCGSLDAAFSATTAPGSGARPRPLAIYVGCGQHPAGARR